MLALVGSAQAAPGQLDPSFGTGGKVLQSLSLGTGGDWIYDAAIQPDGKIVVVGSTQLTSYSTIAIARYLPSGVLDQSFNANGVVVPDYGYSCEARAVAIQPDGRIAVASTANGEFRVSRYLDNGAPDASFNGTGTRTKQIDGGTASIPSAVIVQTGTGRIIVGGKSKIGDDVFALMGLEANGANAAGFGTTNGTTYVSVGASDDRLQRMVVQPSGKIVAVGTANGSPPQVAVARFTATGQLDTTFGGGSGTTLTALPGGLTGDDGASQSNGSIVVAGQSGTSPNEKFGLTRIGAEGGVDAGFGVAGLVTLALPTRAWASAVAVQPDDRIVVAGLIVDATGYRDFGISRLSSSGVLDTGFGTGGYSQTPIGTGDDQITGLALQPDGNIVASGSAIPKTSASNADYAIARYLGDPKPTPSPVPTSKITSPKKGSLKRTSFTKISGTAGPDGSIAKVEIAVRKIDTKALKKKRCVWLSSKRAKLKKNRSTAKKKCTKQIWLKARGTTRWSFSLKKKKYLPKGSYEIYSRVTLTNGTKQTTFTTKAGNFRKLKLK